MRSGMPSSLAAAAAQIHVTTFRRWRRRAAAGRPLASRPGPRPRLVNYAAKEEAATLVRQLHGLVGAEALRHSIGGLSRRQAAAIKSETVRAMERERKAAAQRITVTAPGVLRGFDAMQLGERHEGKQLLVCADGAVPYRTTCQLVDRYDSAAVAKALEQDLRTYGAPLVVRLDRAKQHLTAEVRALLDRYEVLVLHGPPHRPQYYGQLERQNQEHRAWCSATGFGIDSDNALEAMRDALNTRWRRYTLDWQTAAEAWERRAPLLIDRRALGEEVRQRSRRLRKRLGNRGYEGLAERLAIERTLEKRGLLKRETGGWVLRNSTPPK